MSLDSMTKKDLVEYAETLGIDVGSRDTLEQIRSKINTHNGIAPTVDVAELEKAVEKASDGDAERELTVVFQVGEDGNSTNVFFSINGKAMSLPRNQEVKVKKKYIDMLLNDCSGFKVIQTTEPTTGKVITKQVKTTPYPFQIVG